MLQKYLSKVFASPNRKAHHGHYLPEEIFRSNTISPDEYGNNVIVYRCVNIIAQAASHVPWIVYEKNSKNKTKLLDHPIYNLLKKPNHLESGADFFSNLVATKLLYGDAFICGSGAKKLEEIYLLHPKQVQIVEHQAEISEYVWNNSYKKYRFPINKKTMFCRLLHLKNYNPTNNTKGISSIKAAAKAIELHNYTTSWNISLLKNGARPTGALVMKDNNGYLTDEQFERLKEQIYEKFAGASNCGKPLLLEGGLDWKEMSINPRDMDFIESKNSAAREIALAFGLPPQLLGIIGDNTYSNMQEARIALWEETIIPLLDKLSDNLSNWLSRWYGTEIIIDFDKDNISALSAKRYALLDKLSNANFMTINEKRAAMNLCPIEGGEKI